MSLQISWSVEGEQQLSRVLTKIGNEVKDWTPAFEQTVERLKEVFATDVLNQGKDIGVTWPPLSKRYLNRKVAQGYSPDPLIKTGKLANSFQSVFQGDYGEVWNAAAYAKYHQSAKPRKVFPPRIILKLGENQKQLVVKIFHQYWFKKVNEATA